MRSSLTLLALTFQSACAATGEERPPAENTVAEAPALWIEGLDAALFEASEPPRSDAARDPAPEESKKTVPSSSSREAGGPTGAPDALAFLAIERLERDDLVGAAVLLEEAYDASEGETRLVLGRALADAWLGLGHDEAAARLYGDLLAQGQLPVGAGSAASLRGNLAVAYYRLGRDAEARREVTVALEADPRHAEAMKTMGWLERRAGRQAAAVEWFERAIALSPSLPEARLALAEWAEESGSRAQALMHYRVLLAGHEAAKNSDFHHRWRNLFGSPTTATGDELRRRIERLRAAVRSAEMDTALEPHRQEPP